MNTPKIFSTFSIYYIYDYIRCEKNSKNLAFTFFVPLHPSYSDTNSTVLHTGAEILFFMLDATDNCCLEDMSLLSVADNRLFLLLPL